MGFYYFSAISVAVGLVLSAFILAVLLLIWIFAIKGRLSWPWVLTISIAVFLLPWVEELWIAYQFGSQCGGDVGLVVNKTATVDGFYDDTRRWTRIDQDAYAFVESREEYSNTYWRVERAEDGFRQFRIDKPTARFWYRGAGPVDVAHRVKRFRSTVVDRSTGEEMARFTSYTRDPSWLFIALNRPVMVCHSRQGEIADPNPYSIYRYSLKPAKEG